MLRSRVVTVSLAAALLAPAVLTAQSGAAHYHVVKRTTIGGDGGWDYLTVDTATDRLFVSRGTHVMVVDLGTGKVVGDLPNTSGVHGIALAPELHRGFTSNGRDSTVTIFDPRTLSVIGTVKVTGANPDAILYEPTTKRVFTFNGRSADATAIDAATGRVVGTIPLGGKPEFAVADGNGRVLVNIEDRSQIVAFDARSLAVKATWPLAPCESPSGLAIDRAHARLFAGCENRMMAVVDANTGRVVATVPIGEGVDANRFDPATQLAFASTGRDGMLTVAHEDSPDHYTVVANVPTQRGARTMELDPRTHAVYTVTAEFGAAPAPTAEHPHPRPAMVPGSFTIIELRP
ncbi:MAG TPA: YncE family protein [Gemmatimonadaceae bacterium]|nr:YncE family protein [Gemmatimonadaceae bacterium]